MLIDVKERSGPEALASPCWVTRWSEYVPMVHIGQVPKVHIFIEGTKKPAQWRATDSDRGGQRQEARRWAGLFQRACSLAKANSLRAIGKLFDGVPYILSVLAHLNAQSLKFPRPSFTIRSKFLSQSIAQVIQSARGLALGGI